MAGQATGRPMALLPLYYVREKKNESQSYNLYATKKDKIIIYSVYKYRPGESLDASMTVTLSSWIHLSTDGQIYFYSDLLHLGYTRQF